MTLLNFSHPLTEAEQALCEMMQSHPRASNSELAKLLCKAQGTVEKQLEGIYVKIASYMDTPLPKDKRSALKSVLKG